MPLFNTPTRKAHGADVTPSSRDSISGWLDVLTSMLSLPESQRVQVRDELEDHLRSRVDDLLITGTPEPEAIRIAVAELGETAELAKLISHAHTRANPRRRIMNIALITAAVAGLSIGGYSLNSAPSAGELDSYAQAALAITDSNESANETRMLDIVNMPTLMAFDIIADMWGYEADIHSLAPHIVSDLQHRNVTIAGEMTLARAIQTLKMQSLQHASELTTEISGDVIELLTRDEKFRRETVVRTYSLEWSNMETATQVFFTLNDVIGNGQYGQYFTARFIGNQLVVDAREQAHQQILGVLKEAEAAYKSLVLKEQGEHDQAVVRIQTELDKVSKGLWETKERINLATTELTVNNVFNPNRHSNDEYQAYMQDLSIRLEKLQYMLTDYEERYTHLRTRLLESEYAKLFDGLN